MNAQSNTTVVNLSKPLDIPAFAQVGTPLAATPSSFAAFKEAEAISFVRQYDPRVQAIEGYRHAVIRYRNTDKKLAEKTAQMVTVPQLKLTDDYLLPELATKVLLGTLEDEQDNMIRSMIETSSTVKWNEIVLDSILASLTALRVSNRLSKEQIEAWAGIAFVDFCNTRADQISLAKQYNPEQSAKQRAGTLTAYKELAMKLAAPVPNIGQEQATALKNMLTVAKLDDDMAKVLKAKLEAILNPKVVESGDL